MRGPFRTPAPGALRMLLGWVLVVVVTAVATTWVVTRVGQDVAGELVQPLPTLAATVAPRAGTPVPPPVATGSTGEGMGAAPPVATDTARADAPTRRDPVTTEGPTTSAGRHGNASQGRVDQPTSRPDVQDEAGDDAPRPSPAATPPRVTSAPAPSRTPQPSPERTPTPSPATRTFSVAGGTVAVRCRDTEPVARSVTPVDGYRFEVEVEREPPTLRVKFSNEAREDHLSVTCRGGVPARSAGEE